jgi:hypothetical protein
MSKKLALNWAWDTPAAQSISKGFENTSGHKAYVVDYPAGDWKQLSSIKRDGGSHQNDARNEEGKVLGGPCFLHCDQARAIEVATGSM